jgi:hypothetical protein
VIQDKAYIFGGYVSHLTSPHDNNPLPSPSSSLICLFLTTLHHDIVLHAYNTDHEHQNRVNSTVWMLIQYLLPLSEINPREPVDSSIHVLDLTSGSYDEFKCHGDIPEPRVGHVAGVVDGEIIIFGGVRSFF